MRIKRFAEFIKEMYIFDDDCSWNGIQMIDIEDQFLRIKEIFHYTIMYSYNNKSIYIRLRPNTTNNIFKKFADPTGIYPDPLHYANDREKIREISDKAFEELNNIKRRIEEIFAVSMCIEKCAHGMGFVVTIETKPKNVKEAVGITPNYTTGNAHSYDGANLAKARKYVEELAAKDKNELFKIANLQSSKKRSWSEWKWDIDKAMDIATQYFARNPEGIKDTDDVNTDGFLVKTGFIPYTNNIGGVYTNNISQNTGTIGGKNALGPDSLVN